MLLGKYYSQIWVFPYDFRQFLKNQKCCVFVIHHFPGKGERSWFLAAVPFCNNPEFLSGTQQTRRREKGN